MAIWAIGPWGGSRRSELERAQRAQAVHVAARWQWHDMSVTTATREHVFYDYALLYPQPFAEQVQAAAKLVNLEAPLIYGVIRQESLFRTDIVSAAGAVVSPGPLGGPPLVCRQRSRD